MPIYPHAAAVQAVSPPSGSGFVLILDNAGTRLFVPATPDALPVLTVLERELRIRSAAMDRRAPVGGWLRAVADHARAVQGVLRGSRRARL